MLNNYTLTLNKQGMDIIVAALAEMPYKHSQPVMDEAMRQFVAQESAATEAQKASVPEAPAA